RSPPAGPHPVRPRPHTHSLCPRDSSLIPQLQHVCRKRCKGTHTPVECCVDGAILERARSLLPAPSSVAHALHSLPPLCLSAYAPPAPCIQIVLVTGANKGIGFEAVR